MFEIHVTVLDQNLDLELFQKLCIILGVKPLIIQLGDSKSETHVMTSSIIKGSYNEALASTKLIESVLKINGITSIRLKIESATFDSSALYVETHIELLNKDLDKISNNLNLSWVKSFNTNKPNVTLLTARNYTIEDIEPFHKDFKLLSSFSLDKKLKLEYAVYDTNPQLDNNWIY